MVQFLETTTLIPLKNSPNMVKVDDHLYDYLSQFNWRSIVVKGKEYAAWKTTVRGKEITVYMHSLIVVTSKGKQTDQRNHDTLDNREENLFVTTHSQNQINNRLRADNPSGYKGVTWNKQRGAWKAQIRKDQRDYFLGYFDNPRHAAYAYDLAARDLFGTQANLNFTAAEIVGTFLLSLLNDLDPQ